MSAFTGPQQRGAMAAHRKRKRREATERNARTLPQKRAAFWRELADGDLAVHAGPCAFWWKHAYENQDAARAALAGMAAHRKRQGLRAYECPGNGHWHLGRNLTRSAVAWHAAA